MTLEKAIEINTIHNDHNPNYTDAERNEAHQLGIEALKLVKELREGSHDIAGLELSGETIA